MSFEGAYLDGANFRNANLKGTNFSTVIGIEKAIFEGAIFDFHTIWSVGFDAKKFGAQLI